MWIDKRVAYNPVPLKCHVERGVSILRNTNLNQKLAIILLLLSSSQAIAQTALEDDLATADLAEIDRRLNNPLTSIWSLTVQNNSSAFEGDAIDGTEYSNNFFFQPFMPFEVGAEKQAMLTLRPVFPLVTQPVFDEPDARESYQHVTGLGDIQLLVMAGPNDGKGLVWGAGATFKFPTASEDELGRGKYQAGPAGMLFYMGKPWTLGLLAQHWSSFAGEDDRDSVSQTDIQYVIRRSIPGAMSIGMGPTISIDWEADSDNRLTVPVGLGITKTTRWGNTPFKLRAEVHYSVVSPDNFGSTWNLRLQVTPVIASPVK